jgi:hypothetical protein
MGRLFKIAGNGNIRSMIEVAPITIGTKQNPAYRFAADQKRLAFGPGVFC